MIFARIRKWIPIGGIEHVKTDWTVYLDKELKYVLEEQKDSEMLEVFISPIEIPKGETYYVKPVMKFNREEIVYDIDAIPVQNLKQDISNMLLREEPYIEAPYLVVTRDDIFSGKPDLFLKSSKFRSNIDVWYSTSFFIWAPDNTILFSQLDEKEKKEGITIPNMEIFKNYTALKLGIIHKGLTGIESKLNIITLQLQNEVDYTITTNLINVPALEDLEINIEPLKKGDNLRIARVDLCNKSTGKSIVELKQQQGLTWIVPKDWLKEGYKYKIGVTKASTTALDNQTYYHDLEVNTGGYEIIKSEKYEYKRIFEMYDGVNKVKLPDHVLTEAIYTGTVFIPNPTTKKFDSYRVEYQEGNIPELISNKSEAQGLELLTDNAEGTLVRMLGKTLMLVDTLNEDGKPTFLVYEYAIASQTFTLLFNKTREDETKSLGYTGSLLQISKSEVIYNPVGRNWIRKYDFIKNEVTELPYVPYNVLTWGNIIRSKNNRVFVCNTVDFNACVFNYIALEYTEGYMFGPTNFINKNNLAIPLINGNTLLVNKQLTPEEAPEAIEEFSYNKSTFTKIPSKFDKTHPTSAVLCLYGEVILTGHEPGDIKPDNGWKTYTTWVYR